MSKKHYEALAAAIVRARDNCQGTDTKRAVDLVAREIAEVLYADNPACDPERFLAAAGVEQ